MISRLDSMEANLHKLEDNERTLFAQNQALSSRLNSSISNVNKPIATNDIFILIIISISVTKIKKYNLLKSVKM